MRKDLPPEERLLRLIRGQDKKETETKPSPGQEGTALAKATTIPTLSPMAEKRPEASFSFSIFNLFNFLLVIIAITLIGYLGWQILNLKEGKDNLPLISRTVDVSLPEADTEIEEEPSKPYSYYSQEIGKKDLFKSSVLQGQEGQTAAAVSSLSDLSANLVLLGIVLDQRPQAIIEDAKTKKSYFLYKGDSIGEIKVEDILESKVILSYQQEKIELVP